MLKEKIQLFAANNLFIVFKGNLISKLVLVVGGVLLAKYYGPEEYGCFNIFLSLQGIITVLLSLGFGYFITLVKRENNKRNNLLISILISLFLSIALIIIVLIVPFFKISKSILVFSIIASFFLSSSTNISLYLAQHNAFKQVARISIIDATLSFGFQAVFSYFKIEEGLIYGTRYYCYWI